MWNNKRSILLSKCFTVLFMAVLLACVFFAQKLADFSLISEGKRLAFLTTIYIGSFPAAVLLLFLFALLKRIGEGSVFDGKNVAYLRYISWCCFVGAAVSFASFYWFPWFAVGIAAGFVGLIVRVVKNVIAKAVSLQDDVDHTI